MKERIIALLLAALMLILVLAGCGAKSVKQDAAPASGDSVIVDENGLKIVSKDFVDKEDSEPYINLEVTNSGDKNLRISPIRTSINQYMMENIMLVFTENGSINFDTDLDVPAGKTITCGLLMTRDELGRSDIGILHAHQRLIAVDLFCLHIHLRLVKHIQFVVFDSVYQFFADLMFFSSPFF